MTMTTGNRNLFTNIITEELNTILPRKIVQKLNEVVLKVVYVINIHARFCSRLRVSEMFG